MSRIGLFGGSFNPPHAGHLNIAQIALDKLALDEIWWIVTPQNPLKENVELSTEDRILLCEKLIIDNSEMSVSNIEQALKAKSTFDLVVKIKNKFPDDEFVWIGGMDSAVSLDKWQNWRELLAEICTFYVARPPLDGIPKDSPILSIANHECISLDNADEKSPVLDDGITYFLTDCRVVDLSSTALRNNIERRDN